MPSSTPFPCHHFCWLQMGCFAFNQQHYQVKKRTIKELYGTVPPLILQLLYQTEGRSGSKNSSGFDESSDPSNHQKALVTMVMVKGTETGYSVIHVHFGVKLSDPHQFCIRNGKTRYPSQDDKIPVLNAQKQKMRNK